MNTEEKPVAKYLKETFEQFKLDPKRFHLIRKPIVCNDGFKISVQGSEYHYCTPRQNVAVYTDVECGFPSEPEELLIPYAEANENLTETVYPFTPIEIVEEVMNVKLSERATRLIDGEKEDSMEKKKTEGYF
jgi:hypothetical protein